MIVTVLFFASLRESLGTGREQISLPEGVTTAGQLRAFLRARGPAWDGSSFPFSAFLSGALLTAVPGIIAQLILIPLILTALQKAKVID